MRTERWKKMSVQAQYEFVFGNQDPSVRKLRELCYKIRVVSRKDDEGEKCCFCQRDTCEGCPLPFDDKITLFEYL